MAEAFEEVSPEIAEATVIRQAPSDAPRLLWRRRRLLLRSAVGGLLIATALAFLIPNRYQSSTRLMPPDSDSSSMMATIAALSAKSSPLGGYAGSLLGIKSSGALFVGILRSRTVQQRIVDRFQLKKVYRVRLDQDARTRLADNTFISEDRKSGIITITVTDKDPKRAAAMAAAYAEELDRLVADLSTSSAHRERVFLEQRLNAVKMDLEAAEKELSQFSSKNTAIDIKEQGRAMVEAMATLQGQLIAARSELEGLRQIYTDENVRVRAVNARIAELQRQIQKLGGSDHAAIRSADSPTSSYPSIRELPILGVTYADMYRRTKIQEAVYETLTQQYELAKVQEAKETPSVKVLDKAEVPEKKSYPSRLLIIFLATCGSGGLAAAWILAGARWKQLAPEDPRKILASEIVTAVEVRLKRNNNGTRARNNGSNGT
jgi:uncharacterized protein involved in exopolysaccharide biosynthesis